MNRWLTYLGLVGYVFIGAAAVLMPAIMPSMTEEFAAMGLTVATIAFIFPARAVGGILGNLLAGVGSDLMGRQRLVWLSAFILASALALTGVTKSWMLFVVGFALVSVAQAALSTGINAMIADANPGAQARALNMLHGIYGVGAAVSPLIIGYLIERGMAWRWALGGTGFIWLLYGIGAYLLYRTRTSTEQRDQVQQLDLTMLRKGAFFALFLIAFAYNGVAWSLLGWIALFMQQSAGLSTFFSISMISIFYIALTGGRFICAAVAERVGYARLLLVLAIGITLTYPLVLLENNLVVVIGVFLTGLSLSGLFPTALAFGARLYPEQTGTMTGTLNVAMTLGSMVPPLWTGVIAERTSFQVALGVNYMMVLPLILIALYLRRIKPSREINDA